MHGISIRKVPTAVRYGLPLAAVAVVAAACGSGTSAAGGSTAAPAPASGPAAASGGAVTVKTTSGSLGTYLTDQAGKTLYLFTPDTATKSVCDGGCATTWPPLTTSGNPSAGSGVTAGKLTVITRSDGTKQVAYAGHPLYYFQGDAAAGQTNGEGLMSSWYVLSPAGAEIKGN